MKKKIIGIFIILLLITTVAIPLTNSSFTEDDCGGKMAMIKKSYLQDSKYKAPTQIIDDLPEYFSWKDYQGRDWTTPAKHQGGCGSCWIFAALAVFESMINIREGKVEIDPDLSEQYALSCLPDAGGGCDGGDPWNLFECIMDTSSKGNGCNGVILESCFPYEARDTISCNQKCPDWEDYLIPLKDYGYWNTDESIEGIEAIKTQIMQGGPVVTCIQETIDFSNFINDNHNPDDYYPFGSKNHGEGHDIVIVGWKDDPSIGNGGYWILKNSKGDHRGYDGFCNIEYGMLGSEIDGNLDTTYIVWVDYDPESYFWENEIVAPGPTTITGPQSGNNGEEYEYIFNAVDQDGDDVKYHIDWGDGNTETTDFSNSGSDVTVTHIWSDEGNYTLTLQAEDTTRLLGPITTLEVSMPKTKDYTNPLLRLFENYPNLFPLLRLLLQL